MSTRNYIAITFTLIALVFLCAATALYTGTLPNDADGYHYQYMDGQIVKIKVFEPPPGTVLMTRIVNGQTENYYGTSTEQAP